MPMPKECPVGPDRKRKRTAKKNLEAHVVRECLAFLRTCPDVVYIERRNTGAVQFEGGGFIRFGAPGAADIWCLVKIPLSTMVIPEDETEEPYFEGTEGYVLRHVELEMKRRDGKGCLSPSQKKFQGFCSEVGVPYYVVTNEDELKEALREVRCGKSY